jgi:RNA polymerase sigma factor (sigma-70 family)
MVSVEDASVPTALAQLMVELGRTTPPDAGLLERFVQSSDEEAFAELVAWHGPMVLAVCRRVLRDQHLAEDSFQAAFIVLARRAAHLKTNRPLGPWLYGVAYRTALGAQAMRQRQQKLERQGSNFAAGSSISDPDDATVVLDEEIARLSEKYRSAVVLCELQGLSRSVAATQLGIPEGTLSYRLAVARKTLAKRLRERGVVLGTALGTTAALSRDLLASTVALSTGKLFLSAQLVQLVHGATQMALLSKLKLVTVAVAFCCLLGAGGLGIWPTAVSQGAPALAEEPTSGKHEPVNKNAPALQAQAPAEAKKPPELTKAQGPTFTLLPVEQNEGLLSWVVPEYTTKVVPTTEYVKENNLMVPKTVNVTVRSVQYKKIDGKVEELVLDADGKAVSAEELGKRWKGTGTLVLLRDAPRIIDPRKYFGKEALYALPAREMAEKRSDVGDPAWTKLSHETGQKVVFVSVKAKGGTIAWTDFVRTGKVETAIENVAPVTRQVESEEKLVDMEAKLADLSITDANGKPVLAADIETQFKEGGWLVRSATPLGLEVRKLFAEKVLFLEPTEAPRKKPVEPEPPKAEKPTQASAFANEFLADTQFSKTFDHPIWVRWSKHVGKDRSSRELFAELLRMEGSADILDKLEGEPKEVAKFAGEELKKLADLRTERQKEMRGGYSGPGPYYHSLGENTLASYLALFAEPIKKETLQGLEALHAPSLRYVALTGPWTPEKGFGRQRNPENQRSIKIFQPATWKLMIATQMKQKVPGAVYDILTRAMHDGKRDYDPLELFLPLAKMACTEKEFPALVRAAGWMYLVEGGLSEYLPDMAKCQEDANQIVKFSRGTERGSYEMNVLVSDVAIAAQLKMHRQKLRDFGFFETSSTDSDEVVNHRLEVYGFPIDGASRKAAHEKALAFLKSAPALPKK